jgi:hypothetical protein
MAGYPEASQATTALVLGIIGLVACQICSPFAWSLGHKELEAIDAGRRPPENRGMAQAGKVLGIVGTALLGIGVLALIGFIVFIIVGLIAAAGSAGWS